MASPRRKAKRDTLTIMNRVSPADRDRARRRVRALTTAAAVGAAALTVGGAAAAAGTFAGRTVSADASTSGSTAPTDTGTLQPPDQAPSVGPYIPQRPVTSGGS
jgi:hypothetical protein